MSSRVATFAAVAEQAASRLRIELTAPGGVGDAHADDLAVRIGLAARELGDAIREREVAVRDEVWSTALRIIRASQ